MSSLLAPDPLAGDIPRVYDRYEALAPILAQRNDTTYLINFWATWCKPCLDELPLLQELSDETDGPLRLILISLDTDTAAIARIPDYLARRGIDLPTVVLTDDRQDWKTALDEHWDGTLPTSFIYRNELRYIYRRNFRTLPDVREAVRPLLGG
ncbi:TlpA family protein disulfide reductase [Neolewinella maritima]|uniref:TlpA family protein disulfide reductase n=1 Tax=Neolewinella maritima TaxID=1383882 RepID=UPI001EE878CB|nr:TlpA disulfide reductase family protein [Neolewinella maritima]